MKRSTSDHAKSLKAQKDDSSKKTVKSSEVKSSKKPVRCYGCGEIGHRSKEYPKKALGVKCFKGENYGHIAANCDKDVKSAARDKICNLVSDVSGKCEKDVIINGIKVIALVDSGTDITLMREEQYKEIGKPVITDREMQFRGAGLEKYQTLGGIQVDMCVDGETYTIKAQVVPNTVFRNALLLETDFLNSVNSNIKKGVITITSVVEDVKALPDVFRIDEIEHGGIDLEHIKYVAVKAELSELIQNYEPRKSKETGVEMRIVLTDDIPVYQRARRLAEEEKNEVESQLNRWLQAHIIKRSTADYSSPVVPVRKKDGTVRVCVDYRSVNQKAVKVHFPQPIIEEQLDKLQDAKVYTILDLKDGFFHVPIEEKSRRFAAFTVPRCCE